MQDVQLVPFNIQHRQPSQHAKNKDTCKPSQESLQDWASLNRPFQRAATPKLVGHMSSSKSFLQGQ